MRAAAMIRAAAAVSDGVVMACPGGAVTTVTKGAWLLLPYAATMRWSVVTAWPGIEKLFDIRLVVSPAVIAPATAAASQKRQMTAL